MSVRASSSVGLEPGVSLPKLQLQQDPVQYRSSFADNVAEEVKESPDYFDDSID